MGSIIEVTDETLDSFIDSSKMLLTLEFWDPWCNICTEMAPIYEDLALKNAKKAVFGRLNMRENRTTPDKFAIYVTPTFIFLRDGKELHRVGGLLDPSELETQLKTHL